MDRDDAEGAIAAATYFISLYSYVYATGDLLQWQAISDPECVFCSGLTSDVHAAAAIGTTFTGGSLAVTSSIATPGDASNFFRVDLTVSQAPFESIDSTGAARSSSPGTESAALTAVLEHNTQGWLVRAATSEVLQK
jgi:hypothetical protein